MSDEIICLSSDDEDAQCIENSTNSKTKSDNAKSTKRRRLSDSSFEDEVVNKVKKQRINNGTINIDDDEEDSKPKSDLNSNHKKSVKFESTTPKSRNKSVRERSPSPVAGTSKYFDMIENQIPKKSKHEKKEEKLSSSSSENSESSENISDDKSKKKDSTPISEKPIKRIKPQLIPRQIVPIPDPSENIFEKILETCREKKNDEDMRTILENIKKYYDTLSPTDKNCEDFRLFLNGCLNQIQNANQFLKFLVNIKTEIIRRIKLNTNASNEDDNEESEEIELSEENAIKVRKLEKVIKDCKAKIERLENKEVDFDEDDNSAYIMVDRYKKKIVELCNELSRITNDKMLKKEIHKRLLRRKDIPDEMTGLLYVDEAIIRFINSSIKRANELKHIKNPNAVPSYLLMPDYVDILQCIKQCNEQRNLELKNRKMEKLAEKAFKAVGNYLKNQRLQETKDYLLSFVENSQVDPAKNNQELSKQLKNNKEVGMKKLEGIFAKYVAKQEGLSSEGSASENDSSEDDETNDEGSSSINNEDISSTPNEDNASNRDEDNSSNNEKKSIKRKNISEDESNNEDSSSINNEDSSSINNEDISSTPNDDYVSSRDEDNSSNKVKKSIKRKNIIPRISSDDERSMENLENNELCKESNVCGSDTMNRENDDDEKPSTIQKTISPKKSTPVGTSITFEKKENEKIQSPRSITETVNILSEICEVSNSSNNNENKQSCDSEDEIKILSEDNDTDKENNKASENDSQDIILEIEDEDPLSITDGNAKKNSADKNDTSTSKINCAEEEKKKKIDKEKNSNEIQNKKITTSKKSDQEDNSEKDSKDNNDNDFNKINNENTLEVNKKMHVEKSYPLRQSEKKDTHNCTNTKMNSEDEISDVTKESSFLKVKSFAKPPESWMDKSPEKPAKRPKLNIQQPIQQVLQQMSKPECVDLTNENEMISSSSTRFINPLALKKRRVPVKKVVVVKNVVNNFNFSLPADGVKNKSRSIPQSKVQFVNPQIKSILVPKSSSVQVNQVPPNNHNQRRTENSTSIVRTPFLVPSTKKKSDNSNSSTSVK